MQTTIELQLEPKDHLAFQLYISSQSKSVMKKRLRSKLILPIIYTAFAILLFAQQNVSLGLGFILLGISWFYFYPMYESKRYERKYAAIIKKSFGDTFAKNVKLEFADQTLTSFDDLKKSKTKIKHISEIDETATHYFILLKSGMAYILPKNKVENLDEFRSWLDLVLKTYAIQYFRDLNWKWK